MSDATASDDKPQQGTPATKAEVAELSSSVTQGIATVASAAKVGGAPEFSSALVIDDAYDQLVSEDYAESIRNIKDAIRSSERENQLREVLATFGCSAAGEVEFTTAQLEALYEHKGLDGELQGILDTHLFNEIRPKRTQVELLTGCIKAAGIAVTAIGSGSELPENAPDVIFLDYFLGATNDEDARKQAVSMLQKIEASYAGSLPFVVLMSSTSVSVAAREGFRSDSRWAAGLFDFSEKRELTSTESFRLRITLWEMFLPHRLHMYAFVEAVQKSLHGIAEQFMVKVRSLGVEDYAFLQRLHLSEDGQPLGEYMLWLFGSALPHLAFDEDSGVVTAAARLDKSRFDSLLPMGWEPSQGVAEFYKLAISTPAVSELTHHPLDESEPPSDRLLYLQMGDVLYSDPVQVWLVASPACDMALAPQSGRGDRNRFIVLVPGTLERLGAKARQPSDGELTTPLFEHEGVPYRICWDPTKPEYVRHSEVRAWSEKVKCGRIARLRLPYALDVQQAFAHNLLRIGMPVPPPLLFEGTANLYVAGEGGSPIPQEGGGGSARIYLRRKDKCFQFSYELVKKLIEALGHASERLAKSVPAITMQAKQEDMKKTIAAIDKLRVDAGEWRRIVGQSHDLPSAAGITKIADGLIHVHFNRPPVAKMSDKVAVVVNLMDAILSDEIVETPVGKGCESCSGEGEGKAK